ncbi:MAG: hypothetical protein II943_12280 [Victivallales bacterium]|nr:hypothetical protein [Victivallales bacterium]
MKMKSRMLLVAVVSSLLALAGRAADFDAALTSLSGPRPKLFYDFTSFNEDGTLKDLSDNGHDGQLSGGFDEAYYADQNGLFFNGKDTKIVPADAAALKMTGRMSVYLRLRIEPEWGERMEPASPLVFGSVDGGGVNRNYSLFFDHGNELALNIGKGTEAFTFAVPGIADGKVHSVVFTVIDHAVLAYCDGKCVLREEGSNLMPDQKIGGPELQLGTWGAGAFLGELYELAVFDCSLNNGEVLALAGITDPHGGKCYGTFTFNHSNLTQRLDWHLAFENVPLDAKALELLVDGQQVWRKDLAAAEVADARLGAEGELDMSGLEDGRHKLEFRLLDADGKVLYRYVEPRQTRKMAGSEMFDNTIGISDDVLPPWTPIAVSQRGENTEVALWNRTYTFGDEPLACEIYSGAQLSAGVSGYALSIDGADARLAPGKLQVLTATPAKVVLLQTAENDAAALGAQHNIEYDGFNRIQVKLTAKRDLTVDRLHFAYPLNRKYVKATMQTINDAVEISGEQRFGFLPVFFLGDEERGLSYLAASDQNWFPVDHPAALAVKPADDATVVFEVRPIDAPLALKAGESLEYEFALTATPIRPMADDAWKARIVNIRPYCREFRSTIDWRRRGGKTNLDYYTDAGMKAFIIWRNGKAFGYPPIPGTAYSDNVKALVAEAHARGLRVFPYAVGYLFSDLAPEWNESRLFIRTPKTDFYLVGGGLETETGHTQHTWEVCNHSKYFQNLMLYRVREAILETDMDGVYLDGSVNTRICTDELHGCGYIGRDGQRRGTYNVFGNRELLKRLHTLIYQLKGDAGIVDLHFSVDFNAPAAAWATSLWSGEHLLPDPYAFKALPPLHFRMGYTGVNIGVPDELLHYRIDTTFEACLALAIVHGVPIRAHDYEDIDDVAALWRQRETLGLDEAQFVGYWKEECPVVAKQPGVYVSCYVRKDNSVVAVVSNLTEERQTVELAARRDDLAVPAPFALDSQDFRILEIGK